MNNHAGGNGGAISISKQGTIFINECLFIGNQASHGGALSVSEARAQITNCMFIGNIARANGGAIVANRGRDKGFLTLKQSKLINNSAADQCGAVSIKGNFDFCLKSTILVNNRAERQSGGLCAFSETNTLSSAIIDQCTFINCTAPSIYLHTYIIQMINSTVNVSDTTPVPVPHVQLNGRKVFMVDIKTKVEYPNSAKSNTILKAVTVAWTKVFNISHGISISCSRAFKVEIKMSLQQKMEIRCQTCPPNLYALNNELRLYGHSSILQETLPKCLKCPPGALCDGQVRVIDNHWGKQVGNELSVIPCPDGYYCSSQTTPCNGYNTCAGPRTGTLCGTCEQDYVQNYMGGDCVLKKEAGCNLFIFLNYFVLVSLAHTIGLTLPQWFANVLKRLMNRFKESTETPSPPEKDEKDINIAAYFTLVIYFIQIASLVHIDVLQKDVETKQGKGGSKVNKIVFDALNFKLSLEKEICPMDDLNLIGKLFFNIALKLCTFLHLIWLMLLWKCVTGFISWKDRRDASEPNFDKHGISLRENTGDPTDRTTVESLPFPSVIKVGLVKLIKLNFTSTVNILLLLVHCEKIANQFHLYIYGDFICYSCWQILIIGIALPTVALFPTSLGISLDLLKKRQISVNLFLLSCGIPFVGLGLQLKKCFGTLRIKEFKEEEERCTQEILQLEEELYKSDNKGMRWPVIQLYRNLLVVVLDIFILHREYKILWYFALFMIFTLHDRYRMPFKHPHLNQLQVMTSVCFFFVTICSVPSAFSSYGDIMAVAQMSVCLTILKYFEYFLYLLVPLSLHMWKVWVQLKNKRREGEINVDNPAECSPMI